jgi:hypothetical protein
MVHIISSSAAIIGTLSSLLDSRACRFDFESGHFCRVEGVHAALFDIPVRRFCRLRKARFCCIAAYVVCIARKPVGV